MAERRAAGLLLLLLGCVATTTTYANITVSLSAGANTVTVLATTTAEVGFFNIPYTLGDGLTFADEGAPGETGAALLATNILVKYFLSNVQGTLAGATTLPVSATPVELFTFNFATVGEFCLGLDSSFVAGVTPSAPMSVSGDGPNCVTLFAPPSPPPPFPPPVSPVITLTLERLGFNRAGIYIETMLDVVIAGIQIDIAFPVASDLTVVLGEVLVEAGYELEFSDEAIVAIGTGDNLGATIGPFSSPTEIFTVEAISDGNFCILPSSAFSGPDADNLQHDAVPATGKSPMCIILEVPVVDVALTTDGFSQVAVTVSSSSAFSLFAITHSGVDPSVREGGSGLEGTGTSLFLFSGVVQGIASSPLPASDEPLELVVFTFEQGGEFCVGEVQDLEFNDGLNPLPYQFTTDNCVVLTFPPPPSPPPAPIPDPVLFIEFGSAGDGAASILVQTGEVIQGVEIQYTFSGNDADLVVELGQVLLDGGFDLEFAEGAIVSIGTGDNLGGTVGPFPEFTEILRISAEVAGTFCVEEDTIFSDPDSEAIPDDVQGENAPLCAELPFEAIGSPPPPCPPLVLLDANLDGNLDVLDAVLMINAITGKDFLLPCEFKAADGNEDGSVDVLDVVFLINVITGKAEAP